MGQEPTALLPMDHMPSVVARGGTGLGARGEANPHSEEITVFA